MMQFVCEDCGAETFTVHGTVMGGPMIQKISCTECPYEGDVPA